MSNHQGAYSKGFRNFFGDFRMLRFSHMCTAQLAAMDLPQGQKVYKFVKHSLLKCGISPIKYITTFKERASDVAAHTEAIG